jgi:hypothetical protein
MPEEIMFIDEMSIAGQIYTHTHIFVFDDPPRSYARLFRGYPSGDKMSEDERCDRGRRRKKIDKNYPPQERARMNNDDRIGRKNAR